MADLIDRNAALTAICAKCPKLGKCPSPCVAHRALRDMPSSRSIKECSEAHWIDAGHGFFSCEGCKMMRKERSQFCPNCGAYMLKEVLKKWPEIKSTSADP